MVIDVAEVVALVQLESRKLGDLVDRTHEQVALRADDLAHRHQFTLQREQALELDERDYFRDVYDHLIRISDLIDSYRDLLSGATDLYLSTISNRQNDVMKQLTVIATIFLPLSFITGFFGMNFGFMVDHITRGWTFWLGGVGSMLVTVLCLLVFFRRKNWV